MNTLAVLTIIGVSFGTGAFFGALIMFYMMYNTEKNLRKELDHTNELLNKCENYYEDII